MFESLFRFLFKYPPLFFEQGDFVLGVSRPMLLAVVAAGLVGGYALLSYRGVLKARGRDRVVLVALRLATLAVIAFCLLRPGADSQGRRAAAEFPRRPARRFAQPADRRSRRPAAQRVRRRRARPRPPAAQRALEKIRAPLLPVLLDRRSRPVARRAEVRRAARRGSAARSIARATSCRACRWPGW